MVCTQMIQEYMRVEGRGQPCEVLSFHIYMLKVKLRLLGFCNKL